MLRVALKGLLGHKLRFALTAAAVVLGVTFLAGSFVLTDSIQRAFDGLFDDAYAETDVFVNPVDVIETDITAGPPSPDGPTVPAELVDRIAALDGVSRAAGFVEGTAKILDADGQPLGAPGAPGIAESSDPMSPVDIAVGAPPAGPDEVAIDRGSAEQLGVGVGDEVEIFVAEERRTFTITGTTSFGSTDSLLGATVVSFDPDTAQELFGRDGGAYDNIAVEAAEGVDPEDLRDRIAAALDDAEVEVVTAAEEADSGKAEVATALGFLTTALLVFAGVSLFVSAFIIANTFSIVVAQRSREFALLRALGASTRQVRTAVTLEAVAVGIAASALGLGLGIGAAQGIRGALSAAGLELPSGGVIVAPRTVLVSFLIGIGVTVVSAMGASRRASRAAPVEAMRGVTAGAEQGLRRRVIGGGIVTVIGVAALAAGLFADTGNGLQLVGLGAAATLLGVALLAPLFAGPVAAVLGGVAGATGISGRLAQRNAGRDRRRTAATASALMIGLALVTFVSVLTATLQGAVADTIGEQFRADFIVQSTDFSGAGMPAGLATDLRDRDEVGTVSAVGFGSWLDAEGDVRSLSALDPDGFGDLLEVETTSGAVEDLVDGGVLLSDAALEALGLTVGDEVATIFASGAEATFEVVGSYDADAQFLIGGDMVVAREGLDGAGGSASTLFVYADAAGDVAAARTAVDEVAAEFPSVTVQDQAEFRDQQEGQVDTILNLFLGLLALALFIALLGIANTLALAVFERTREIGLLRAVGLDRGQAGRMIVLEAVIVSIFGALLGLVVGTGFGWAVVRALGEDGAISGAVVPYGRLAIYVVAAAFAGAIAAIFPAWRAARLDVLRAVTTE